MIFGLFFNTFHIILCLELPMGDPREPTVGRTGARSPREPHGSHGSRTGAPRAPTGPTIGRMDGQTYGQTNGRTDGRSYARVGVCARGVITTFTSIFYQKTSTSLFRLADLSSKGSVYAWRASTRIVFLNVWFSFVFFDVCFSLPTPETFMVE